ncbi:hypothetical protein [Yoonia sp. BS5-3]|uniref:Sulfotransferase domain-containing protein n=1 Tax=Yoonia phaeophyticola TaxID=3137369 RepID=A0ABZ2V030_9RHOB
MSIFDDPMQYVRSFDWQNQKVDVVPMNREKYSESTFLDRRTLGLDVPKSASLARLLQEYHQLDLPSPKLGFIFHTAFCGSTLLSRCLDLPGYSMVYKEPLTLHQVAFAKRYEGPSDLFGDTSECLSVALTLLGKNFTQHETILIKPSDSCANIAREMLSGHEKSAAIFLFATLDDFCVSMLKYSFRREFLHKMLDRSRFDLNNSGHKIGNGNIENDAQAAAVVWLALIIQFDDILKDRSLNARSLNKKDFFRNPENALDAAAQLFGVSMSPEQIERATTSGPFKRHSKNPGAAFDHDSYFKTVAKQRASLDDEIQEARNWIRDIAPRYSEIGSLARPLI